MEGRFDKAFKMIWGMGKMSSGILKVGARHEGFPGPSGPEAGGHHGPKGRPLELALGPCDQELPWWKGMEDIREEISP